MMDFQDCTSGTHHDTFGSHHDTSGFHHDTHGACHDTFGTHHDTFGACHDTFGARHDTFGARHDTFGAHHHGSGDHYAFGAHHNTFGTHHGRSSPHTTQPSAFGTTARTNDGRAQFAGCGICIGIICMMIGFPLTMFGFFTAHLALYIVGPGLLTLGILLIIVSCYVGKKSGSVIIYHGNRPRQIPLTTINVTTNARTPQSMPSFGGNAPNDTTPVTMATSENARSTGSDKPTAVISSENQPTYDTVSTGMTVPRPVATNELTNDPSTRSISPDPGSYTAYGNPVRSPPGEVAASAPPYIPTSEPHVFEESPPPSYHEVVST